MGMRKTHSKKVHRWGRAVYTSTARSVIVGYARTRRSVEAARYLGLSKEEIRIDEVPAQDRSTIGSTKELLTLVEDEVTHQVIAKFHHKLKVLFTPAPSGLSIRLLS